MERVTVLLETADGAYLFFKDKAGLLTPPFGFIKVNEGPKGAAARILKQMTGLAVSPATFNEVGPCIYNVRYNVNLGPTTFNGEEEWLDYGELREILRQEPERLSEIAKDAYHKGLARR